MTTIRWSPEAADDLEGIRDFIARDSPHYATLVVRQILDAIEGLGSFPQMGRPVPELRDPDQREVIVLHVWAEMTFAQIATAVGGNVNTIAGRYRYALANLRKLIAEECHERT